MSNAEGIVDIIMSQLERIGDDDPERVQALRRLVGHIYKEPGVSPSCEFSETTGEKESNPGNLPCQHVHDLLENEYAYRVKDRYVLRVHNGRGGHVERDLHFCLECGGSAE